MKLYEHTEMMAALDMANSLDSENEINKSKS